MMKIKTRRARSPDMPKVIEMIQCLSRHHGDVATIDLATLERDAVGANPWITLLVAEVGGHLQGYAALCPLMQVQFGVRGMDMHHLFVLPDARGRGVGQALISASITQAKAQGCRYIMVGTAPENSAAQNVYRAAGFDDMPPSGPRFRMKF